MSSIPLVLPNLSVLSGKNVLITGGASGLSAALTKKLAENGAHITIADIQAEKGEAYASQHSGQSLY
jgi:NAD(P)-dependent dehydrogenase (short-subunit alcohol dehydrogenase family)